LLHVFICVIQVLSFSSSCRIEEVASSCNAIRFYQLYVWCLAIDLFFSKFPFLLLPDLWNFSLCTLGVQEKGCFGNVGTAGWEFRIQGNCFDSWHACAWQAWSWHQKQVQCLYLCWNLPKFSEIMFFYNL
jgi:hypothetical protein